MHNQLYIKNIYPLFEAVQKSRIFEDQKIMVDAIPKYTVTEIMAKYEKKKTFSPNELKIFVLANFEIKDQVNTNNTYPNYQLPIEEHIEYLWDKLTRVTEHNRGTLLKLPKPYIVPGGRFDEFFYWDSYYIMLGLQVSGRIGMMKNIVENCAYLINTFGFVPNASRTYFLSRSQPPYFSLMLDLIYESTNDETVYVKFFNTLVKEYEFWMSGVDDLKNQIAYKRVLKTKYGDILNRYFDEENIPRPESYLIDLEGYSYAENNTYYRNIRSACESGWDFSSRWLQHKDNLGSIQTLAIAQLDLNCLLYHLEKTLAKSTKQLHMPKASSAYLSRAASRQKAIEYYFWNEKKGIYTDYLFLEDKYSDSENITTLYPLFLGLTTQKQAELVAHNIHEKFLKDGGLITTTVETGQQWDAPNAWAPFQWLGYKGLTDYGFDYIAQAIKTNWCTNVERIYSNNGMLMEKYNAIDTQSSAGGGEYPNQEGFGWTNGVYLKLKQL